MWITSLAHEVHDRVAVGVRARHVERADLVAVQVEASRRAAKVTTGSAALGDGLGASC